MVIEHVRESTEKHQTKEIFLDTHHWEQLSVLCNKCLDENFFGSHEYFGGYEVLDDGSVRYRLRCDRGHDLSWARKPSRKSDFVMECEKCGKEFLKWKTKDWVCPSCGSYLQYKRRNPPLDNHRVLREYGELCHKHDNYGTHPISRKHKVRVDQRGE